MTWHGKGDYLASVSRGEGRKAVMIHQVSKAATQCPFRKTKVLYSHCTTMYGTVMYRTTNGNILFCTLLYHIGLYITLLYCTVLLHCAVL